MQILVSLTSRDRSSMRNSRPSMNSGRRSRRPWGRAWRCDRRWRGGRWRRGSGSTSHDAFASGCTQRHVSSERAAEMKWGCCVGSKAGHVRYVYFESYVVWYDLRLWNEMSEDVVIGSKAGHVWYEILWELSHESVCHSILELNWFFLRG